LKVIEALIAAVAHGRGGVLVIEGPPGIGKSRLLTEVLALADKAGVRSLFGEAFEYQQTVPFFALFMATLRADPPVGDAEGLRRLGGSADLRYWVVHDLANAIHAAAAQTPLVILLEDIHWADNGTLLALRSLAVRHDAAVLWRRCRCCSGRMRHSCGWGPSRRMRSPIWCRTRCGQRLMSRC
jgi:predicted ATPase